MTVNEVLEAHAGNAKLEIREIPETELILIQGDQKSIRFLGELLIALSENDTLDLSLSPKAAGSTFFNEHSTKGVYFDVKRQTE